ncbi:MAG TPA: hypothetical protein VM123_07835 [archaeon]|nr:hypothetical protein [archaeon]
MSWPGFRRYLTAFGIFLNLHFLFLASPAVADDSGQSVSYLEDYDHDGEVTVTDVIALLLMALDYPADPRVDYNGDGKYNIIDAVALAVNIAKHNLHQAEPVAGSWRVLGPGGGGAMFSPTINPYDPDNVLLRCDMTGAYVTFDAGASWRMFNLRTAVEDFEFDPSSPGTVYACNTDLYRSEDGGARWRLIYPDPANVLYERMVGDHSEQSYWTVDGMPDAWIDKVRVDPANSDHLLIGLHSKWDGPAKILVSNDRGQNWRILAELPGDQVLAVFPGTWWDNPDEVLAITDIGAVRVSETSGEITALDLPDTPLVYADGGKGDGGHALYVLSAMRQLGRSVAGGVFRSTDRGGTWNAVNEDLTRPFTYYGAVPSYNTLAVCQSQPEVAYLACASYSAGSNSPPQFGIFKTVDSGENWDWVYRADWDGIISKNFSESWYTRSYDPSWSASPHELGVCPTKPDICYAADGHSYRTLDGGKTWQTVYSINQPDDSYTSRGLDVTTCYGVHFDPFDSLHIFISYTDIGLFHSFNGGESWVHAISGIGFSWMNTCYWLVFDPEVKDRIWSVWSDCHDLPRPKMFYSGKLARGEYNGGPAVSQNGGLTWLPTNRGMNLPTVCTHIILDPASPAGSRTLYICGFGRGVFKSTDDGKNWSEVSQGLGNNRNAWRIVLLPDSTLFLVVARGWEDGVGDVPGAVYRSKDGAQSWQAVELPEGVTGPNDLAFDPSEPRRMYLSCWPRTDRSVWPYVEIRGGLYRTEDGGAAWKQVFYENAHVYAAAVDPRRPSTIIINTFDSAAFRSDDRGETWYRLEGYTFKWGHRPILDPWHPDMLYLTTFGGSVFYGPAWGVKGAFEGIENLSESWRWPE